VFWEGSPPLLPRDRLRVVTAATGLARKLWNGGSRVSGLRWGVVVVSVLIAVLLLPPVAEAGRAITGPCRTVFCAGVSQDGSRVVFPFEEELTAGAGNRQIYERSGGRTRPLLPAGAQYWPRLDEVSSDAAHVFVTTNLTLSPEDADGFGIDVFDVSAGRATLISTGPLDGADRGFPFFAGSSPNGQRAFFEAFGPVTAQDTDSCYDLYERSAGQTALVAPSPAPPPAYPVCDGVRFGGVSAGGTHLFFTSGAELEPGDERGEDIYQQVGSTFTRLTTYPEPESGCVDLVKFADASSDGGTVLFTTNVQVVAEDADSVGDVYKRRPDGTFALVSRGTDGGTGQCGFEGDRPVALSADGSTAIFETTARLSPADADSSNDLYSADDSGAIELLSTGPTDASVDGRANNIFPDWLALASDDARRVAFETPHPLAAADRDAAIDVYLRAGGQTELISAGPAGRPVGSNAELLAVSADGGAIVFATKESLVPRDLDRDRDVYLRGSGQERSALLSAETIAPRIQLAKRGGFLPSGGIGIRLSCPKTETSGPCRGRLVLKQGRRGARIGAASFRIDPGQRVRATVRLRARFRDGGLKSAFARVRGIDALGNARLVTGKIRFGRG
jgi:hypothetical protein